MNAKHRRHLRRKTMAIEREAAEKLGRYIVKTLTGCSPKVWNAITSPGCRKPSHSSSDNVCIPHAALYMAGYRKSCHVTVR